jgi:hypothetical protein
MQQDLQAVHTRVPGQGLRETVQQQPTIGETGHPIVEYKVLDLVFGGLGIGDISCYGEDAGVPAISTIDVDRSIQKTSPLCFASGIFRVSSVSVIGVDMVRA